MIDANYRDEFTLPVTIEKDGGDTAHRCGMIIAGKCLRMVQSTNSDQIVYRHFYDSLYNKKHKVFVRHPDEKKWYSDPDRLSRDQSIPLLTSMFLSGNIKTALKFFKAHAKHLFLFAWNTRENGATIANHGSIRRKRGGKQELRSYSWKVPDFTGPLFWGIYIRGFKFWPLYPILLLSDLQLLANTMIFNKAKKYEANNLLLLLSTSKTLPTPLGALARRIIKREKLHTDLKKYWGTKNGPYVYLWYLRHIIAKI